MHFRELRCCEGCGKIMGRTGHKYCTICRGISKRWDGKRRKDKEKQKKELEKINQCLSEALISFSTCS